MRADKENGIPNELMANYYSMRSSYGLILTESCSISPISNCFPGSFIKKFIYWYLFNMKKGAGNIYTAE